MFDIYTAISFNFPLLLCLYLRGGVPFTPLKSVVIFCLRNVKLQIVTLKLFQTSRLSPDCCLKSALLLDKSIHLKL